MLPRRNEPCPCGSGQRYKTCCGVVASVPDDALARYRQGNAALAAGQWADAIAAYDAALRLQDNTAEIWLNRGIARLQAGQGKAALADYAAATRLAPTSALIWHNYGCALAACGDPAAAAEAYRQAIAGQGTGQALAHTNLAELLRQAGDLAAARAHLQAALQLEPQLAQALHNLGVLYQAERQPAAALPWLQSALRANPQMAEAYASLGSVYLDLMQLPQAQQALQQALALQPAAPRWHWNLAMALLLQGQWLAGWREYEWGLAAGRRTLLAQSDLPRWHGEPLAGRRLLVVAEQGLGDTLQFYRYLQYLPADTVLACQPALLPLLQEQGGHAVVPANGALPPCDLQVPLLSLPAYLAPELPPPAPYLRAPSLASELARLRLAALPPGRRIGLAWAGNPENENDRRRSLDVAVLEPLRQLADIQWISLQLGHAVPAWMHDCGCDFAATAGLMQHLDLIISVDSSLLHLAGALGRPVILLNRWDSDWRWQASGSTTSWYPTLRIVRQPSSGDWAAVVQTVAELLQNGG